MSLKFRIGKVKAKGTKEFMYKELNNPSFIRKVGLNRVELTDKNVKHLPLFELFLLNTPQLKDEYNRLQDIIRENKVDMLQMETIMKRYMVVYNNLKARGIKNLRPLKEKSVLKDAGEVLYTDLAFGIKPKTRKRWEKKENKFWKKLAEKTKFDVVIKKK